MATVTCAGARLNGILAVECDRVRLHDRLLDLRLGAAIRLAPTLCTAELLLLGAEVNATRLHHQMVKELLLPRRVVLDLDLALRVAGL